jgi:glycosyltransferase involved in cell wall biosynthesis
MKDIPRTLIIDFALGFGGASSRVLSLLEKLPSEKVALAALEQGWVADRARMRGLPVFTIAAHKASIMITPWLLRLIRENGFQVLDTQNIQSKFWGSIATSLTGVALVSTLNSWYAGEHGGNIKGRIYQGIESLTNRNLDLYIAVSRQIEKQLLESGIPQSAIAFIPNAIEVNLDDIKGDRKWLKKQFPIPEDSVVCCAVGRLVQVKGYDQLIQALAHVRQEVPKLRCIIVGDGELRTELEKQVVECELDGQMHFAGMRDRAEVLSIIKASDFFVMPSRSEGTPVALLEAGALGCPVLATGVGGIPEMVVDGEEGLLVPSGDIHALSEGIVHFYGDRVWARRLGENLKNRINREFNMEKQVKETAEAYLKALDRAKIRLERK